MDRRSRLVVAGAALGGCLLLLVCISLLGIGAYWVLSRGNPLEGLGPTVTNRIVYVGADSNIYVVDATGKLKTQLTHDGTATRQYAFPSWSQDSRHIAFVGIDYQDGAATGATLISVDPTGGNRHTVYTSTESVPFFLYWSPNNRYVTFLSSKGGNGLALQAAPIDRPDGLLELESGSPLYFAWSPNGSKMLLHVGGTVADSSDAHLALLPFQNQKPASRLSGNPGSFDAPEWSPDGNRVLFSQEKDGRQSVAAADAEGNGAQTLFEYDGRVSFAWSPTGKQIAYIITPANVRLPNFGALTVIDADGKSATDVTPAHVLAFLWSPNGHKLAFLTITLDNNTGYRFKGQAQTGGGTVRLQWQLMDFDTKQTRLLASFVPTEGFLNTLPFFDQYARSSTFWSPDSSKFVFMSTLEDGTETINVADAAGSAPPVKIAEGGIAFWSWK